MPEEKPKPKQISIMPVIVDWCNHYVPCTEAEADEIFTIGRLRDEFSAWLPFGTDADDPLVVYIEALEANGFTVHQTYSSGPAILCKYRQHEA